MDSFYGGKQGISFVIKDRFKSIHEMEWCFANGYYPILENNQWKNDTNQPYNNTVWYGEYCIIDAENRNDKDNGKIFRRTGNHTTDIDSSDTQHTEYVGQVLGPAGGVPNAEIENFENLESNFSEYGEEGAPKGLVYYYGKPNGSNESQYIQDETGNLTGTLTPKTLKTHVDYKSGRDYYNDNKQSGEFKYEFYTYQGNEAETDDEFPIATMGLGLEVPYADFDITEIVGVNPEDGFSIVDTLAVDEEGNPKLDGEGNPLYPFYHQYKIEVPVGVPGPSLRNIQIINRGSWDSSTNVYNIDTTKFEQGKLILPASEEGIDPFASSLRAEIANLYYYDYSKNNGQVIGYTPVKDPTDPSKAASFYIRDIVEVNNAAIDVDRTASNGQLNPHYGTFTIETTNPLQSYTKKLPLIQTTTVNKLDGAGNPQNNYYLHLSYADGKSDSFTVAPSQWGVWATKLTDDGNGNLTPPGPTPGPGADITNIDRSAGDLGILIEEAEDEHGNMQITSYSLYFWDLTQNNGTWSGKWKKLTENPLDYSLINLEIKDFEDDSSNPNSPIQITHTSIEGTFSPQASELKPWK